MTLRSRGFEMDKLGLPVEGIYRGLPAGPASASGRPAVHLPN
jgi:hypothetical protein